MNNSKTLKLMEDYLVKVQKYCPCWTEYSGKGAEKKTRQLEALALPLYNKYHTTIREPMNSFKGSVILLGESGLALPYMVDEIGEFIARVEYLQKNCLELSKQNQELHSWYKDLYKFNIKSVVDSFVSDFKQWKELYKLNKDVVEMIDELYMRRDWHYNKLVLKDKEI